MKNNLLISILNKIKKSLIIIGIFVIGTSYAQKGVFYFVNANSNNKIVDIIENNQELYLLGKYSDSNYKNLKPYFLKLDKNGNKLLQKIIASKPIYELNKLITFPDNSIKIYGSQLTNNKYSPFYETVNTSGIKSTNDYSYTVFSTLLGDISYLDSKSLISINTKLGKSKKYSILFEKLNVTTNNKVWSKNIEAVKNEEASQIFVNRDMSVLILGKRYNAALTHYLPILYKYTSDGELIWKHEIKVPKNFYNQSVCSDKKGNIYYICGYTRETTGKSETRVIKYSPDKIKLKSISFENFSANGILPLSNGTFIIYGSNLKVHEGHVITKAKFIIINKELADIKEDELGIQDKPDSELPKEVVRLYPTSSDLLTAIQLKDGRIAIAGRVNMPINKLSNKINMARQNNALLILMDKYGNFRK